MGLYFSRYVWDILELLIRCGSTTSNLSVFHLQLLTPYIDFLGPNKNVHTMFVFWIWKFISSEKVFSPSLAENASSCSHLAVLLSPPLPEGILHWLLSRLQLSLNEMLSKAILKPLSAQQKLPWPISRFKAKQSPLKNVMSLLIHPNRVLRNTCGDGFQGWQIIVEEKLNYTRLNLFIWAHCM